jgi:hypothetical protein
VSEESKIVVVKRRAETKAAKLFLFQTSGNREAPADRLPRAPAKRKRDEKVSCMGAFCYD